MARARNIKPGFFVNDDLADCEPLARLLFIGLWTIADAEGRLKDRPRQIKAQILPYDECDTDSLLINLEQSRFIQRYSIQGQPVIQVVNFAKHQNPHKNEKEKGSSFGVYEERDDDTEKKQQVIEESGIIEISPDKSGATRDESLLPITESLNPLTESGTKKDEPLVSGRPSKAKKILEYLNNKTGKGFKPVPANIGLINSRLKEGHSDDELMTVITMKTKEWINDQKMAKFLRPATLFGAKNFNQYVGEIGVETPQDKNERELQEWINGEDKIIEGEVL